MTALSPFATSIMADWTLEHDSMDKHSSAVVAPLNITKSPKKSRAGIFGHSRQSSRAQSIRSRSQSQSQISPPLTPKTSQEAMARQIPPQPVFHNYLRAFYHYNPSTTVSSSTDESSITVAIKQGDVILVHSVHPNGWADGTLLASGARGWLPTNYCEPYDHPAVRNLLNALTHLWDLVREGENGDLLAFMKQDYVRGMIAGIRYFLVSHALHFQLISLPQLTVCRKGLNACQETHVSLWRTSVYDECAKASWAIFPRL
jgi:hypothetical protein